MENGTEKFDELDGDDSPVGDFRTRTVQKPGRVDIRDEYLQHLGLEVGDQCVIECKEDKVVIKEPEI